MEGELPSWGESCQTASGRVIALAERQLSAHPRRSQAKLAFHIAAIRQARA